MSVKKSKVQEVVKAAYQNRDFTVIDLKMENGDVGQIWAHKNLENASKALNEGMFKEGFEFSYEYIEKEKGNQIKPQWAEIFPNSSGGSGKGRGGGGGYNSPERIAIDKERLQLEKDKQVHIDWAVCLQRAAEYHIAKDPAAMTEAKVNATAKKFFDYEQTIIDEQTSE